MFGTPVYEFRFRKNPTLKPMPCTRTNDLWEGLYRALEWELFR